MSAGTSSLGSFITPGGASALPDSFESQQDKQMKIKKITGKNIKRQNFEHEVGPFNLIVGDIRTGKTARADALLIALTGESRTIGKKDIRSAITGNDMVVSAVLDSGQEFKRGWTITRKGTCSAMKFDVPEPVLDTLLINPTDILALSPAKVKELIVSALPDSSNKFDWKAFDAKTGEISIPAKFADLITDISDEVAEIDSQNRADGGTVEDFLKRAIESQKEQTSGAAAVEKRSRAAIEADAGIERIPPRRPAGEVAVELGEVRKELTDLAGEKTTLEHWQGVIAGTEKRRSELEELKERKTVVESEIEAVEKKLSKLTATLEGLETQRGVEVEQEDRLRNDIQDKINAAGVECSHVGQRVAIAKKGIDLLESGTCPTCGNSSEEVAKVVASMKKELAQIEIELKTSMDLEAKLSKKKAKLAEERAGSKEMFEKQTNGPRADKSKLSESLEVLRQDLNRTAGRVSGFEVPVVPEGINVAHLPGIIVEISEAEAKIEKLEVELESAKVFERPSEAETHRKTADNANAEQVIRKEFVKILQDVLDQFMRDSVGKVLARANRLVEPVLGAPLVWNEGILLEGASFSTLSGSERAVVSAGLALAFAVEAEFRLLILDELGTITPSKRQTLFEVIETMIKDGTIDQFFGILPVEEGAKLNAPDFVNVIEVVK